MFAARGNHEEMFLKALGSSTVRNNIYRNYGPSIEIAIDQLSEIQVDWISSLPHPLEIRILGRSVLLSHGSLQIALFKA